MPCFAINPSGNDERPFLGAGHFLNPLYMVGKRDRLYP